MQWAEIAQQAATNSWVTAFSTVGEDGRPHVAFVSPGLANEGHAYVATWKQTRKAANVAATQQVAMHWPVGDGSLPPVFMRGIGTLHDDPSEMEALWKKGGFSWDLDQFFPGGFTNKDLVMIDVEVSYVSTHTIDGPVNWRPAS